MKSRMSLWGGLFVILLASILIIASVLASRPDMDLHLTREVTSDLDLHTLGYSIGTLSDWPKWFFSLDSVEIMGSPADKTLKTASILKLHMDPKRGPWSKFDILVRVLDYQPGHSIRMQVIADSKNKLTLLFDRLEWQVDLIAQGSESTLVRGTVQGHTSHWRSRIFGQLFPHILMNQVYYPDIIHLALLDKPEPKNPFSD